MSKIYQIGIDQITTNYFSTYYVVQYNLFKTRDLLRNLIYIIFIPSKQKNVNLLHVLNIVKTPQYSKKKTNIFNQLSDKEDNVGERIK